MSRILTKTTSIFGLKLYLLLLILISSFAAAALLILLLRHLLRLLMSPRPPPTSSSPRPSRKPLKLLLLESPQISKQFIPILNHRLPLPPPPSSSTTGESYLSADPPQPPRPMAADVTHLGWGRWFTLSELDLATDNFSEENVVGEGGYGVVFRGVLTDGTVIAVKNLLNNRGQAEREFKVEVEAMGRVRHKNLVKLLGFCIEGAHRMLVYEYVDNGNLDQWLHGDIGQVSPLSWDVRMKILLGTAKGLAYLHEGLEPKVIHRDVKSSNILLDLKWNPKVSDFGLAKLICSGRTYVTTRVMGTFGYVAPEYASTGMLNERSDVYSFGVLIMETISGRTPVDYTKPPGEMNLVEWLKTMVGNRRSEEVLDPKMREKPSAKALKRLLLVGLHCVDPDAQKRPKMGHVIHMIESEDLLFKEERRVGGEETNFMSSYQTGWR